MKLDLTHKVAVVSGSTSGIGLGIAKGLAWAGATVVIVGRQQRGVDTAIAAINAEHPDAQLRGVVADLSTEEGVSALLAAEPHADVVVNNLGIFNDKDFFSVPDSEWMHFYNVNVLSGVRLSRHYAQGMIDNGWGRIIFVSSESGVAIPADMINYGVTKSANLAVSHG
ncbi:oxidoreductase, partial [Klebsiella pneumoniae]